MLLSNLRIAVVGVALLTLPCCMQHDITYILNFPEKLLRIELALAKTK